VERRLSRLTTELMFLQDDSFWEAVALLWGGNERNLGQHLVGREGRDQSLRKMGGEGERKGGNDANHQKKEKW